MLMNKEKNKNRELYLVKTIITLYLVLFDDIVFFLFSDDISHFYSTVFIKVERLFVLS